VLLFYDLADESLRFIRENILKSGTIMNRSEVVYC
jgi:hypothetical protein